MEFPFPYEPYPIQKEFMKELYSTLENNCIGIFESPTGTVKILTFKVYKSILNQKKKRGNL